MSLVTMFLCVAVSYHIRNPYTNRNHLYYTGGNTQFFFLSCITKPPRCYRRAVLRSFYFYYYLFFVFTYIVHTDSSAPVTIIGLHSSVPLVRRICIIEVK